jgi:hemolysin activation/secretion protein
MKISMRIEQTRTCFILSCLVALSLPLPAAAQFMTPQASPGAVLPPSLDPIPQQTQMEEPTIRESDQPGLRVPDQPNIVQVDKDVFQVNRIEVSGNAILDDDTVRRLVSPYEGHELTADDLATLVAKINEEYRRKGYLTSLAFIPPQDLERGTITVKVLEGIVGDMEIQGNKYFKAKVIESRISEKPGEPLNIPALEKELVRINRQEAFKVRATLSPGDNPGETKVHLDVKEQQPFQIALIGDNMGRPYIGTYRAGVEFQDRNVTGHGDRFNVRYMQGAGQNIVTSGYTLPVGSHGTEVSALFGFSHVDVDLDIPNQPQITGNAYNYGLLLSQPLNKERSWVADLGLNARRASSFFQGDKSGQDDVRSATLGLNFDKIDRYGRTYARTSATMAPEWLGANTSFFKMENFVTRVTRLPKNNLLILRAYSQWTPDALPPIEQFQLGGQNSVRGYTQGLMIGDRGYNVGAEWRWPIPFLASASPWLGERLQGAVFFDYGQAWLDKGSRYYIPGVSNRTTSLMGAGVGLRAHLTDYMQGYVDLAMGLLDRKDIEPNAQPTVRVHFGVRSELLPNDYKARSTTVTPIKTDVFRPRTSAMQQVDVNSEISDPTLEPMDQMMKQSKVY